MARHTREQGESWEVITTDRFEAWHVNALLNENAACIVIPSFLKTDWCAEIARRFVTFTQAHPEKRVRLQPNDAIDITLDTTIFPFDFFAQQRPANLEPYFTGVARDRPGLRQIYAGGADPLELVRAAWKEAGWTELPALEGDKPYHTDVLWGLSGRYRSLPHVDTYHREVPCSISHYTNRLNFSIVVASPDPEFAFRFYRRQRVGEESMEDALKEALTTEYKAKPGDLVIYDASKYFEIVSPIASGLRLVSQVAAVIDTGAREYSLFS